MPPAFSRAIHKLASAETALKTLRSSSDKSVQKMARMFGSAVAFEDWSDAELKKASTVRPDRLFRKLASVNAVMPPWTFMSWFVNEPISEVQKRACACEAVRLLDGLAPDIAENGFRMLSSNDVSAFEPCCAGQESKGDNIDDLMDAAADKFSVEGPKVNERILKLTITIGFDKSASFPAAQVLSERDIYDARLMAESYLAYKAAAVAHFEQTRGAAFVSDFLLSTLVGQNLA